MLKQFLLDGVAVEPGDRAQPARDGPGPPAVAGEEGGQRDPLGLREQLTSGVLQFLQQIEAQMGDRPGQ